MSDALLAALGARFPAPIGPRLPGPPAAEARSAALATPQQSPAAPPAKSAADGSHAATNDLTRLLEDAESFDDDLEDSIGKIGKSLSKLLKQLGRLEDQVEKVGEKLQRDLLRDIHAGRFEDRTPGKAISKALHRLDRLEHRAEKFADRVQDLSEAISARHLDGPLEGAAVSISFSQSLTLSVENLEVNLQGDGGAISVSYSRIAFSLATSVSLAVAQGDAQVLDLEGGPVDLAGLNSGLYLDAENEDLGFLVNRTDEPEPGQTPPAIAGAPDAGYASDTAGTALDALLLVLDFQQTVSFDVTRLVLNAGTQIGPRLGGLPLALDQIQEPGDTTSETTEAPRFDLAV